MGEHSKSLCRLLKNKNHSVGCEVGTFKGVNASNVLKGLPGLKRLYVVDPWETYELYDGRLFNKPSCKNKADWNKTIKVFYGNTYLYRDRVIVMRMTSVEASFHIEDGSLDWVFIDANHEYEYIKENLEIWSEKVRKNGIVSGHDYGNPKEEKRGWGITKAVNEFVAEDELNVEPGFVWWYIK